MAVNYSIQIGRFTKDVELRQSQSGVAVVNFTLAVDKPVKSGEHPEASFINYVAFGKTAEFISKYFSKGNRICVTGYIQTRSYEKDGEKRTVTEVVVGKADFVDKKSNNEESGLDVKPSDFTPTITEPESDEDIPF